MIAHSPASLPDARGGGPAARDLDEPRADSAPAPASEAAATITPRAPVSTDELASSTGGIALSRAVS